MPEETICHQYTKTPSPAVFLGLFKKSILTAESAENTQRTAELKYWILTLCALCVFPLRPLRLMDFDFFNNPVGKGVKSTFVSLCLGGKKNLLILLFLSLISISFSQNSTPCDLKFVFHLVNAGDNEEAIYLLDSTNCYSDSSNDSLNYLRGWSLYSLKRLVPSSESLIKVSPESEFYLKSHFFAAYNYIYTSNFSEALETLSKIELNSEKLNSVRNLELSGIYLLQGKKDKFEDYFSRTNRTYYEISESAENLQKISTDLYKHKTKSPFVAGLLSTIIPGSGKFYAGKRGEAISAFIANAGLGLVTWENYRKSGLKSFQTIAFGSAFVFSYAANIYGAILTVTMQETEYKENVKNSILFNLHIPLRNSFNK